MISSYLVKFCISIRGGGRILRLLSKFNKNLKNYPVHFQLNNSIYWGADLSNNVFFPLLKYKCYPHQVSEDLIISSFLDSDDCVVDVGANIGYVSALCADCVGKTGSVYSFEPSKNVIKYINQLCTKMPQIKPMQYAVSGENGKLYFVDEEMSDRSHISSAENVNSYMVESITIDSFVENTKINKMKFLKIDAEGYDIQVITGAQKAIKSLYPIIEFESESNTQLDKIRAFFDEINLASDYEFYRVYNKYPISVIAKSLMTNNYFAIPVKKKIHIPDFLFTRGYLVPIMDSP